MLTQYATTTFLPEGSTNILTVSNPLGVVPKLVRVRTEDRSIGGMFDLVVIDELGAGAYTGAGGDEFYAIWKPITESIGTLPRRYLFTDSAIEIQRGGSATGRWLAGITYTVHIYA